MDSFVVKQRFHKSSVRALETHDRLFKIADDQRTHAARNNMPRQRKLDRIMDLAERSGYRAMGRRDKSALEWLTLVRCGGHFEGGTVLHWAGGAGGRGIVCAGDILTVTTDRKWLSFMRSYPNFIPLSVGAVEHIGAALKPFAFETIYGHYFDRVIAKDAKAVLESSVTRYVAAVEGKRGYE